MARMARLVVPGASRDTEFLGSTGTTRAGNAEIEVRNDSIESAHIRSIERDT